MSDNKISIIMTAYNSGLFISDAIQSVINQTWTSWELIIINDDSTDNTLAIINSFSDSRIRVYSTVHSGHSVCKQIGFSLSTGDYILFFDSDDIMHPQLLEMLIFGCESTSSDVAICTFKKFQTLPSGIPHYSSLSVHVYNSLRMNLIFHKHISHALWNKLFKRSLFQDFIFPTVDPCSDTPTCPKLIAKANQIAFIPKLLVYYRQHPDSITYQRKLQPNIYAVFRIRLWLKEFNWLWDQFPLSNGAYYDFLQPELDNLRQWGVYDQLDDLEKDWLEKHNFH